MVRGVRLGVAAGGPPVEVPWGVPGDQEQPCRSRETLYPGRTHAEGQRWGGPQAKVIRRSVWQWETDPVREQLGQVACRAQGATVACRRDAGICLCLGCLRRTDGGDTQRPEEAVAHFGLKVGTQKRAGMEVAGWRHLSDRATQLHSQVTAPPGNGPELGPARRR